MKKTYPRIIIATALALAATVTDAHADPWFFGNETKCMPSEGVAILSTSTYSGWPSDYPRTAGIMELDEKSGERIPVCGMSVKDVIYIQPLINEPKSGSRIDIFLGDRRIGGALFQNGMTKTKIKRTSNGSYEVKSCVDTSNLCKQMVDTIYVEGSRNVR